MAALKMHGSAEMKRIKAGYKLATPEIGEDIVISGIAGRFPNSDNTAEFMENLMNKVDLCDEDDRRWVHTHPEIPKLAGKVNKVDKFDGGYFGTHGGHITDPLQRMMLERTYEAIMDAGINPDNLAGTNTGVFIGACYSESEKSHFYENLQKRKYAIFGCQRSMMAQRISYALKLNGPSMICDTACSSGMYAFESAYRAIREGKCDRALVGANNLCFDAYFTLQFARLGVLNMNTGCRPFDENATGYTRSEAIVMMLLQKSKDAKRVYAQIVHSKVNVDGYKELGITYPSAEVQKVLLEDVYEECQIDPTTLAFVEAHGTGTKVGDPEELNAIDEVFCKGRSTPLLIGSIKGNIGHTEPASGLCSIIKMIYAMESGLIPPNIHYENPKLSVEGLKSKRLEVVTEKTPWPTHSSIGGVNSFGFGGANGHVIMKRHNKIYKPKIDNLPRLVCFSGRTLESIQSYQDNLKNTALNYEYVGLMHSIFSKKIQNHRYRGYSIISSIGELSQSCEVYDSIEAKLVLYLGTSQQYTNQTIEELNQIEIFKSTFKIIKGILKSNNINIDLSVPSNDILHKMLLTVSIQIGLIDVLEAMKIQPDCIIGTSFGDFTGAYANGTLTRKEVLLSTYAVIQLVFYSHDNEQNLDNHILLQLTNIISNKLNKNYKVCVPAGNIFQYGTPEYFLFNIINPKMLNEVAKKFQDINAVVINIDSEHISSNIVNVVDIINPKMQLLDILKSFGSLYMYGFEPQVADLYPQINWPVSRGTPMISPTIKWDHTKTYQLEEKQALMKNSEKWAIISTTNADLMFYKGHVIDGRNLFPATGYLFLIWEFFSDISGKLMNKMKICFENVKFQRATVFGKDSIAKLYLGIQKNGLFEVSDENDTTIVSGTIKEIFETDLNESQYDEVNEQDYETLNQKDIYKELKLRGYNYRGLFKGIQELKGNKALIEWTGNYITFMDNMLQTSICIEDNRSLYVPTGIDRLVIDAEEHMKYVESLKGEEEIVKVPVSVYKKSKIIRSKFIEIRGLFANAISRKKQIGQPILETYKFIPNEFSTTLKNSLRISVQIILENKPVINVKVLELVDADSCHVEPLSPEIQSVLGDMPLIQPTMTILTDKDLELDVKCIKIEKKPITGETGSLIFVGSNLLKRVQLLNLALNTLIEGGYILTVEDKIDQIPENLTLLTKHAIKGQYMLLLTKKIAKNKPTTIKISSKYDELNNWLPILQTSIKHSANIVLFSENDEFSGILGLINCLRREPGGEKVSCIFIQSSAPAFNINNELYTKQLNKGLAFNVYKDGTWGTYRHLLMSQSGLVENEHMYANVTVRGDLSSLKWLEGNLQQAPQDNIVHVYNSSINFRDVMTATGRIPVDAITTNRLKQECIHGFEYSGRNSKGQRVMGTITGGAIATMVESNKFSTWPVPDHWSLEDAATVPVIYLTALYGLINRAQLKRGQSILIHSATGGVGLAAINIATHFGCNIFVTVGTAEKRAFLAQHYPHIKTSHVGNSRDTSFEQMIFKETNGRGVDIVLNSLAEEKLRASVRCLANGGNFCEIGKFDLTSDNQLYLDLLGKRCTFHGIMLDRLKIEQDVLCYDLLARGIAEGYVKLIPKTVFKMDQLEQAFRYMTSGKHIGKVIINIREEEALRIILTQNTLFKGIPRYFANSSGSYIIIGGLGGFGLELADWLIIRGAKTIILSSRSRVKTGYQAMRIRTWISYGIKVIVTLEDVTTLEGCAKIIHGTNKIAPIEGIFNLGVVLKDGILDNQTVQDYKTSFAPKALTTTHLDLVTRKVCPNMKYFVCFSSVSCGRGNAGQTNYGMSNSIMERICEKRQQDGFSGLAIQWGAIGDVGLVAEMQKEATEIAIGGTLQQRMSSCLEMMDIFLRQSEPVVASMVVAEKSGMGGADNMVDAVMGIMGMRDLKSISLHSTLSELGMDSMMAVEIKQTLERDYDVFLSAQDMRGLTFDRLIELNENKDSPTTITNSETDAIGQFKALINTVYEESTFKQDIVEIPSTNKSSDKQIILFPGIEATYSGFKQLCSNIKYKSICTQYNTISENNCIEHIVDTLYKNLQRKVKDAGEFNFVAHSFGCIIAFEIAARFENDGYLGKIALFDGSPDLLIALMKTFGAGTNEFEVNIISTLMNLFLPAEETNKLRGKLFAAKTFQERQSILNENLPKDLPYPKNSILYMACNVYNIATSIPNYKPTYTKLKSKVVLYKPSIPTITNIPEDLNLNFLLEHKVDIKHIEGNHATIVENINVVQDLEPFFDN